MEPPWTPQGFSVETPYLPDFGEYMLVLEERLLHIRDSIGNGFDTLYEAIGILSKSLRGSQMQPTGDGLMLEQRLRSLRDTVDEKLSGIKGEIGALNEELRRGRTMSPVSTFKTDIFEC